MKSLYSSNTIYGTLLGQRVEATPGNSGSGGCCCRDSLKKQFKAFSFYRVDDKSCFSVSKSNHYLISLFLAYQEEKGESFRLCNKKILFKQK